MAQLCPGVTPGNTMARCLVIGERALRKLVFKASLCAVLRRVNVTLGGRSPLYAG
jgi:hypothetical protein